MSGSPISPRTPTRVALVVCDVDGTLVTRDKVLTPRAIEAAAALRGAGLAFTLTSARPPRGLDMLRGPLGIDQPVSAFNGGVIIGADGATLTQHVLAPQVARETIALLAERDVGPWVFTHDLWLTRDAQGPHVEHERRTIGYGPTITADFEDVLGEVCKIVGVSHDHDHLAAVTREAQARFGHVATVERSQPYYLDVTHRLANKGEAVRALAALIGVELMHVAAIGDGFNDIAMFKASGFAIAMGNAAPPVQEAADWVTASNEDEGFADAMARLRRVVTGEAA